MERLRDSLRAAGFRGGLSEEEPLAPFTTWRIGGPAELLATPLDRDDLLGAVRWAADVGVPWRLLGNGSNLLVRDKGVRGLVIRLRKVLDGIECEGTRLVAGAGALFPAVANRAAAEGLAGVEFGAGIPGTIGGAIVMNAGWHEFEIGPRVRSVEYLEADATTRIYPGERCGFAYRGSVFRGRGGVVLGTELELLPGDADEIRGRLEDYASSRKRNQPTELPSCGSVFLKPPDDFAGRLIDEAGLKGLRVGDVEVSTKHANFFVNLGAARASDVLELIRRVEDEIHDRFGVTLEREFEVW